MKKILFSILFILLLSTFTFADECTDDPSKCLSWTNEPAINPVQWGNTGDGQGGYVEQLTVRVLDEFGRRVPGAKVNVTWEITRARGLATTKTLQTGSNGRVEFTLTNLEFDPDDMNKTYIVRAGYTDAYAEKPFSAYNGIVERTIILPVYNVKFRVRDKKYSPIEGVTIIVDGKYSTKTSKNGIAYLIMDSGTHIAEPQYRSVDKQVKFNVSGKDTAVDIMLTLYDLSVRVIDDEGKPLMAQVQVGGQSQKSGVDGWANFSNITTSEVVVHSTYGRYKKSIPADLERSDVLLFAFDSVPPVIEDVNVKYMENNLQVRAVVKDIGEYASGLNDENSSVDLFYIGPDNIQHSLPMYSVGYELYEGLIPTARGQNTIGYTIQATDSDGNSASNTDTFVIPAAEPTGFEDSGAQPPANIVDEGFRFDWTILPIVAIVGILIAVVGYWYYNSRKVPSEQESPNPKATTQEYEYNKGDKPTLDAIPKKGDNPPTPPKVPN